MKAGYTIKTMIDKDCNFFYLFNWDFKNEVRLSGFMEKKDKTMKLLTSLGVWKIKKLK